MDELNVKLSHTSKFENAAKDTVTLTKKQLQAILAAFNASEDKEIEDKEKLIRFKRNEEIEDEQDHHTKSKLGCYESSNLKNRKTNSLDRKKLPKLSPESDFSKFDLKKLQWKKERGFQLHDTMLSKDSGATGLSVSTGARVPSCDRHPHSIGGKVLPIHS
ncbi:hypothetical protein GQR58_010803 [Nymphon striatum]|nr:hypothetical protein GQR58_010803 [Nymphon striatum]